MIIGSSDNKHSNLARPRRARAAAVPPVDAGRWDRTSRHEGLIIDPIDSDAIQH